MTRKVDPERIAAIRSRVQAAFVELRKVGFICKSNFSCCMTCATAELVDIAEKRRRNRACYWHHQDEEHFRDTGLLFLRYCYLPRNGVEVDTDTTPLEKQIGEQVATAMKKQGLEIEWDGDPSKTIVITGITPKA